MATKARSHRLFVAIYPPPDVAAQLLDALRVLSLPEHRMTPATQVHMTLQFIGDTDPRDLEGVVESVQRSASGIEPFTLKMDRLVPLPTGTRARLVAVTTDAPPPLLELVRRLALRMARKPRRNSTDRFLPHLTLCRFVGPASAVALPSGALASAPFAVWEALLMRSVLSPAGARHDVVGRAPLG